MITTAVRVRPSVNRSSSSVEVGAAVVSSKVQRTEVFVAVAELMLKLPESAGRRVGTVAVVESTIGAGFGMCQSCAPSHNQYAVVFSPTSAP